MKNIVIFVICILASSSLFSQNVSKVTAQALQISDNYNKVLYGGRLEPKLLVKQYVPASGFVTDIFVQEGTYIEKDTDLLGITRKASGGVTYNPTNVKAIASGVIVQILPSIGQEVFEKSEILTIADTSEFKVNLLVSDKDISSIKLGDRCLVDKQPNLTGQITKISLMPEAKSGLFRVETSFKNNNKLFVGQFIIIELHINQTKGISIPFNSIVNKYGKTFIFLAEKDTAKLTEIKITGTFGNNVIISGVKPGDLFITYSEANLNDGDKIQVEVKRNQKSNNPNSANGRQLNAR